MVGGGHCIALVQLSYVFLQAMFEVITSEASYLKSLNILRSHFINSEELSSGSSLCVLERGQSHVLFSNISSIKAVSER